MNLKKLAWGLLIVGLVSLVLGAVIGIATFDPTLIPGYTK